MWPLFPSNLSLLSDSRCTAINFDEARELDRIFGGRAKHKQSDLVEQEGAMKETIEQYKQRIQNYAAGKEPLKVQAKTAEKIEKLIRRIPNAALRKRPAPDKWSVTEIIAHLEDAEIVTSYRIRRILGSPGTPIEAYDQEKWAEAENNAKRDMHAALSVFKTLRAANLALLKSLKPEQWKHFGMHAERGEESIERITEMIAGHDINHLIQIEGILGSGRK
jgi:hypothetical protein